MADIKEIIERGRFQIPAQTPFEAYFVKAKSVRNADSRAPFDLMFSIRDLLIDLVMVELRPKPEINTWNKRIPMDVVTYAYKMLPHRRMSFVWDLRDQPDSASDYIVCVVDDKFVKRSPDYDRLYQGRVSAQR